MLTNTISTSEHAIVVAMTVTGAAHILKINYRTVSHSSSKQQCWSTGQASWASWASMAMQRNEWAWQWKSLTRQWTTTQNEDVQVCSDVLTLTAVLRSIRYHTCAYNTIIWQNFVRIGRIKVATRNAYANKFIKSEHKRNLTTKYSTVMHYRYLNQLSHPECHWKG